MSCEIKRTPDGKGIAIACSRGSKGRIPGKKWAASVLDVDGKLIHQMKVEAPTHEAAMDAAIDLAQKIPGSFMIHIGLGQRLVKKEAP